MGPENGRSGVLLAGAEAGCGLMPTGSWATIYMSNFPTLPSFSVSFCDQTCYIEVLDTKINSTLCCPQGPNSDELSGDPTPTPSPQ